MRTWWLVAIVFRLILASSSLHRYLLGNGANLLGW